MRPLILSIAVIFVALISIGPRRARAETRQLNLSIGPLPDPDPPPDPQTLRRSGQTMVIAGTTLTTAGAVLLPLSVYFTYRGFFSRGLFPCGWGECTPEEDKVIDAEHAHYGRLALATGLGGLVALGVGIPVLAVGVHRLREASRVVHITPYAMPTQGGIVAGVAVLAF